MLFYLSVAPRLLLVPSRRDFSPTVAPRLYLYMLRPVFLLALRRACSGELIRCGMRAACTCHPRRLEETLR